MIITSNINQVAEVLIGKLKNLAQNDEMLRTCAVSVLDLMKKRVHQNGIASDGSQIGTYSKGYMVKRTGAYKDAKISKSGVLKHAGNIRNTTTARPKYNRTNDTKVIASLTRQMENDEQVIGLQDGSYGIGFSNNDNYKKSQYVEKTYNKKIFALAEPEKEAVQQIVKHYVDNALS